MKVPQFRVRTLLLLTAIMGTAFVACAKWPVSETPAPSTSPYLSIGPPTTSPYLQAVFERSPTPKEWSVRAGISAIAIVLAFALAGVLRHRKPISN